MYERMLMAMVVAGLVALPAFGEPRTWSDDFTTETTYDYVSWLAPCYGPAPSTKYTTLAPLGGSVTSFYAVSGGGVLRGTATEMKDPLYPGRLDAYILGAVNLGQGCPDVFGVPYYGTSEPFTSSELCIYVGWIWNNWQVWEGEGPGGIYGVDLQPGVANEDDDADATTDEADEYPGLGDDGGPGQAGIDDDGMNGTDDIGETKFPGSDDSDDERGDTGRKVGMRLNLVTSSGIHTHFGINKISGAGNSFSIRELIGEAGEPSVESSDELGNGFYQPYTHYNQVFCASGTCYGAMMWVGTDMSNPAETLGPVINTRHNNAGDNGAYLVVYNSFGDPDSITTPYENAMYMGNSNLNDTFYVISGDAKTHFPPITADFDGDKDVDGQDFMKFSKCFNGSLRPPKATCENPEANFDGDIDVDGQDFMAFSKCFNGSLRRPKCLPPILTGCP